ncbi:MAG TPA: dihydrofolate reductase [Steroidobacteraceae bacterium]|nr:dihydrofolate reductase [Steroidobacteraceae bacterium]
MAALVSIVVAMDERNAIGRAGGLPWRLPDDLKRFKALTIGKPVVMGRRTWDSIGKPLPGRHNVVVTRQRGLNLDGATPVGSLEQALAVVGDVPEVCVIGGAEIYRVALPVAGVLHLTRVHATFDADAFFPPFEPADWVEVAREDRAADDRHGWAFSFLELRRARRNARTS